MKPEGEKRLTVGEARDAAMQVQADTETRLAKEREDERMKSEEISGESLVREAPAMSRESLEAHYIAAMLNWQAGLDERDAHQQAMQRLQSANDMLDDQLGIQAQAMREAQERTVALERSLNSYEQIVTDLQLQREQLAQEAQALEARVGELELDLESAENWKKERDSETQRADRLQAENEKLVHRLDEVKTSERRLQAEVERLKKDPLCQCLTDPDCTCHSCLKDAAIQKWIEFEDKSKALTQQLAELRVENEKLKATLKIAEEERDQVLRDHGSSGVGS